MTARAVDGVALPELVEGREHLGPVLARHRVPAQELPALVAEDAQGGLAFGKEAGQPLNGRLRHRALGRGRRAGLWPQRAQVGPCSVPLGALGLLGFGQDALALAFQSA